MPSVDTPLPGPKLSYIFIPIWRTQATMTYRLRNKEITELTKMTEIIYNKHTTLLPHIDTQTTESQWWRHQMEAFCALLALGAGNSPFPGEFPVQGPVTRSFHVFFDLRLNKRLSKQSGRWWFETPSRPIWRQYNVLGGNASRESDDNAGVSYILTLEGIIHRGLVMPDGDLGVGKHCLR